MSQSPPSYMDGVPVKISECFKPPPKITLPQTVINRLAQLQHGKAIGTNGYSSYGFDLEETVLQRIAEWRAVKEKTCYEREERIRSKDQERLRLAEQEQKRKLNQISYPNTDELSSASDDNEDEVSEEIEESPPSGSSEEQVLQKAASLVVSSNVGQYVPFNQFDTILIPTVTKFGANEIVTDDATVLNFNIPKGNNLTNNNNNNNNNTYNKINYSDFENDTSSPFDNMELKTMNDLDILAQVLNLNVSNSCSGTKPEESRNSDELKEDKVPEPVILEQKISAKEQHYNYVQPSQYEQTTYPVQPQQQAPSSNDYYNAFNSYQYSYGQYAPTSTTSTACYAPTDNRLLSQYNTATSTSYTPPFHSYNQGTSSTAYNYFPYTSSATNSALQSSYGHSYLYNNAYGQQTQQTLSSSGYSYSTQPSTMTATAAIVHGPESEQATASTVMRSKSKSVPDIVRQLDEEVQDSAQRRTRNNSQSNAEKNQINDNTATKSPVASSADQDFTVYNQLSLADQNLVKRISSMGFPLGRVATVLKRIGSDDKQIVEHLIPLGELLDLGFEETKTSEALLKFSNNKHKALDYLIS
ncbi:probable basic-leucine zipper transcription factor L [Malaya genurostris]|uniref:probable basic-leucine zipper transcription factor L n=1 Tax=Malaya genurostris TaxID=325434 RepID=UPI0026F38BE4|nr:probable basic-leucine zipper transcription factor L [Malaya genurostris]XP_058451940.1 probable basic-leucine zipper transcription factor L [Malaya genurostris]XP_058451941.1 probable basic-leucine zipper transcription factor L [Malaya genurostris]